MSDEIHDEAIQIQPSFPFDCRDSLFVSVTSFLSWLYKSWAEGEVSEVVWNSSIRRLTVSLEVFVFSSSVVCEMSLLKVVAW